MGTWIITKSKWSSGLSSGLQGFEIPGMGGNVEWLIGRYPWKVDG